MGMLDNRVAVVSGAAMGNGWGIAKVFGREGAHVAMLDVDDEVFEAAKAFESQGLRVSAYKVDVTDFGAVKEAVDDLARQQGKIDILVNNAGIAKLIPFLEMTDEIRDLHFDVNINGAWNCTKAVLPFMVEKNYGKIVNISSVTGPIVADTGGNGLRHHQGSALGLHQGVGHGGRGKQHQRERDLPRHDRHPDGSESGRGDHAGRPTSDHRRHGIRNPDEEDGHPRGHR